MKFVFPLLKKLAFSVADIRWVGQKQRHSERFLVLLEQSPPAQRGRN
jgi:nicotinic acid phosphoribosyltransferase